MANINILITGGCGFIGSHIALSLKKSNPQSKIYVLDNLVRKGSELNLDRLKKVGINFFKGDIRNSEVFDGLPKCDYIIDAAAEPSVVLGLKDNPKYILDNNLIGTINCLDFARKVNAKFIFLSTSRVYPIKLLEQCCFKEEPTRYTWTDTQPLSGVSVKGISEQFPLEGSRTMYGVSKLSSELILQEYGEYYNIPYIINRFGAISGPWQFGKQDQGFVAFWLINHYFKKSLFYNGYGGEGKQLRDVLHVYDLVELILDQIYNFNLYENKTFNIGGGIKNTVSLMELTEICQSISGNKINIYSNDHRAGDIRIYYTDNSKIEKINGWESKHSILDIIKDQYDWLINNEKNMKTLFIK